MELLYEIMFKYPLFIIPLLLPFSFILSFIILRLLTHSIRTFFKSYSIDVLGNIGSYLNWPFGLTLWSGLIYLEESSRHLLISKKSWENVFADFFAIIFIVSLSFCIYRCFKLFSKFIRNRFDISVAENFRQRKVITQLQYIEKIFLILLVILTLGFILLRFDTLAKLGGGVLASAGLASVILGFAAQESVSNLIAGFQIAFTQPFRIDDAVVVENEWGWIEEINLTYVSVRLWDLRRLVLPIKYFTTQPFQNWTRHGAQVIGSIFIHVDHCAKVDIIRAAFEEIVKSSKLWDGKAQVLQVTEVTENTMQIRALASARTSPLAWDLRCEIREELMQFIQNNHPEFLPQKRYINPFI